MDILVTVNCSDKQEKIKLEDLLKLDYFKKMLNNCSTKMSFSQNTIVKNDIPTTIYTFEIPELTIDCPSNVLKCFINKKEYNYYSYDKAFLLELMLYVDMYCVPFKIAYQGGFNPKNHFHFIEYIKEQTDLNPFTVLENGGFTFYYCLIEYGFKLLADGTLNENLMNDLLDYLQFYIIHQEYRRSAFGSTAFSLTIICLRYYNPFHHFIFTMLLTLQNILRHPIYKSC